MIDPADRGFTLGDGLFETALAVDIACCGRSPDADEAQLAVAGGRDVLVRADRKSGAVGRKCLRGGAEVADVGRRGGVDVEVRTCVVEVHQAVRAAAHEEARAVGLRVFRHVPPHR